MKNNLKTRPQIMNDIGGSVDNWEYRVRTEDWFKLFETELQQKLTEAEDALFQLGIEIVQGKKERCNEVEIQSLESQIYHWQKIRYLMRDILGITETPTVGWKESLIKLR